ncbi:unnamed protein product [Trichobilharzia regenti]|nr:unnamed protein product [Trichobilharzia regenti]
MVRTCVTHACLAIDRLPRQWAMLADIGSAMFWEAFAGFSRIDELLSGPDLTIKELLDDDDLLQKCREKDQRLIDFLSRPDNLDYLLDLVSHTPVSNVFDHNLYRTQN